MDTVEVQQISLLVSPQSLNLESTQAVNIIEAELRGQLARRGSRRDDRKLWGMATDSADFSFLYLGALNPHHGLSDRGADDTWRSVRHPDRSHPRSREELS